MGELEVLKNGRRWKAVDRKWIYDDIYVDDEPSTDHAAQPCSSKPVFLTWASILAFLLHIPEGHLKKSLDPSGLVN